MTIDELRADSDWMSAFSEAFGKGNSWDAPAEDNPIMAVIRILASSDGESGGNDWIGIFEMRDGDFVCLRAGCDYTGWDCRANGRIETFRTEAEACSEMAWSYEEMLRLGFRSEPTEQDGGS